MLNPILQFQSDRAIAVFYCPSARIRIFSNPQLFLSGYGNRPQVSANSTANPVKKQICSPEWKKYKSATNPITCGRVNPDSFESDDVKSVFSLSPNNKPIWRYNVDGEESKFPATIQSRSQSFVPLDQRSENESSGSIHFRHAPQIPQIPWMQLNQMCRIRLFPLLFQNGCSQSSRLPTVGQGERSSGNQISHYLALRRVL